MLVIDLRKADRHGDVLPTPLLSNLKAKVSVRVKAKVKTVTKVKHQAKVNDLDASTITDDQTVQLQLTEQAVTQAKSAVDAIAVPTTAVNQTQARHYVIDLR